MSDVTLAGVRVELQGRLVLDVPLAGLDERAYAQLVDELPPILAAFKATTVFVTHSRDEALRLADDLVVLIGGVVRAAGSGQALASNPRTPEVAQVLGYTVLEGADGRAVAVGRGALKLGSGRVQFAMTVDGVVGVAGSSEVVGRIGDARVRVPLVRESVIPEPGTQVVASTETARTLE